MKKDKRASRVSPSRFDLAVSLRTMTTERIRAVVDGAHVLNDHEPSVAALVYCAKRAVVDREGMLTLVQIHALCALEKRIAMKVHDAFMRDVWS